MISLVLGCSSGGGSGGSTEGGSDSDVGGGGTTNQAPSSVIGTPTIKGLTVTLNAPDASDPDGDALTYLWDLDDNNDCLKMSGVDDFYITGWSYVNVGPDTNPNAFTFGWDLWYALDDPSFSGPTGTVCRPRPTR